MQNQRVGIIGGGFIGKALAESLNEEKYEVKLSFRSNKPEIAKSNVELVYCNVGESEVEADSTLFNVDSLVICIPPGFKKGLGDYYAPKIKSILKLAQIGGVSHVIFTSSIGIYTESHKVDEFTELTLGSDKAKALYNAEQAVISSGLNCVQVIRLGGLIGGERHPGRFKVKLTQDNANERVNMVLQDDVVAALTLLIDNANTTRQLSQGEKSAATYNLVSPHHPTKQVFYRYARQQLGDIRAQEPIMSFKGDNAKTEKQVSGQLICETLGFNYQYDSLFCRY